MKFAPISVSLLFLAATIFGCKDNNNSQQDTPPIEKVKAPSTPDKTIEKDSESKVKTLPKEQKSDRTIKKQNSKIALDTLRPKTA